MKSRIESTSREDLSTPEVASQSPTDESSLSQPRKRRGFFLVKAATFLFVLSALVSSVLFYVYQTTQREPDFYHQVSQRPLAELEIEGDQFETKLLDVQNTVQQSGAWTSFFEDEEVNGWLAVDCPAKFPELIPDAIENPRIEILDAEFRLAFRFRSPQFSTIVMVVGDVFVAEPSREIAFRIKQANSGIVPIPISQVADKLTAHLRESGIEVTWTELGGDPLALINIPDETMTFGDQTIRIDSIHCLQHGIEISGSALAGDEIAQPVKTKLAEQQNEKTNSALH